MARTRPGGTAPPAAAILPDGTSVQLEPLAVEVAGRFLAEFPDELTRHGDDGRAWCVHDSQYILAWAVADVRLPDTFGPNVAWLTGVLDARGYPLERLARCIELASDVVGEALPAHARELGDRFAMAAASVRSGVRSEQPPSAVQHARLRDVFLAAVLAAEPASARAAVETAADAGVPVRDLYLEVVQPALEQIGELWAGGGASVAQEHLATATAQTLLARLAPRLESSAPGRGCAVVATVDGELHAIGARFVADFLEAGGWQVLDVGASVPAGDLVALVAERRPRVVALSTTLTTNLEATREVLAQLRALPKRPLLAAGGRAYAGDAAAAMRLGADVFAAGPHDLEEELARRFRT